MTHLQQLVILMALRKTISGSEEPPVTEILQTNILPLLSSIFKTPDNAGLPDEVRIMKLETIWILTNLAHGGRDDLAVLLRPEFEIIKSIDLTLRTPDKPLLEQILWFVGNITGECKDYQELVISQTCLLEVFKCLMLQQRISRSLLKTMCWVNTNISRYKNLSNEDIFVAVSVAKAGLFSEDPDIVQDALWALSYVVDTHDDHLIDAIAQ
jgi:hypothetical protein